jgi:hypothetical protein
MIRSEHVSAPNPHLSLIKAWLFSVPESWDPAVGGPDPIQRGPNPIREVWLAHVEVLDHTQSPRFVYAGVRHFPMGSGPIVDTLEYIIFSSHVTVPSRPRGGVGCCLPRD